MKFSLVARISVQLLESLAVLRELKFYTLDQKLWLTVFYSNFKMWYLAKAFGIDAIDMVCIDFRNMEALETEAQEGRMFGFSGKQVIHPGQIETVRRIFSPTQEALERAKCLILAYDEHCKLGKGAFEFQGIVVDLPGKSLFSTVEI
jgi:citrate lyase beta subunit